MDTVYFGDNLKILRDYEFDGLANKFRVPRNRNHTDFLSSALAFDSEGVPYNANFIAYGLLATDLTAAADAFEAKFCGVSDKYDNYLGKLAAWVFSRTSKKRRRRKNDAVNLYSIIEM